jgi:hypothetical protein
MKPDVSVTMITVGPYGHDDNSFPHCHIDIEDLIVSPWLSWSPSQIVIIFAIFPNTTPIISLVEDKEKVKWADLSKLRL